jgi:hypothetical protein
MKKKLLVSLALAISSTGALLSMQGNNKILYIEYTKVIENPIIEFRFKIPLSKTNLPQYAQNRMLRIMKHINPTIKITTA